jgi:hypothetical protein
MEVIDLKTHRRLPVNWSEYSAEARAAFWRKETMSDEVTAMFLAVIKYEEKDGPEPDPKDYPTLATAPLWEVVDAAGWMGCWRERDELASLSPEDL